MNIYLHGTKDKRWNDPAFFNKLNYVMTATKHPIPKICMHCHQPFVARKYVTKYCSLNCSRDAYKDRMRLEKLKTYQKEQRSNPNLTEEKKQAGAQGNIQTRELINIKMLSELTDISQRTLYRLIQDPDFPKLKIGRSLRFHRATTISFINEKFADHERDIEKKEDC